MNYLEVKHLRDKDTVLCPKTEKRTDTIHCVSCNFCRIALYEVVKCTWSPEKEEEMNKKHRRI